MLRSSVSMRDVTSSNFGLLIAYLLPGFTALWGASYFSPVLRVWLLGSDTDPPTLGGFLYVTLASLAAGLTVSTVRWMVIDSIHHATGIPRPRWDFGTFQKSIEAYGTLTENHYRYYQFYANMLISLAFAYAARCASVGFRSPALGWMDAGFILLMIVLFAGSRDTFRKYHARLDQILVHAAPAQHPPS